MRLLLACFTVALTTTAFAQPYCMLDDAGGRSCGIPTLQQCEATASGVGGSCAIDDSAQLGAPIKGPFQRMFERAEQNQDYQKPSSPELDDVPPPPPN